MMPIMMMLMMTTMAKRGGRTAAAGMATAAAAPPPQQQQQAVAHLQQRPEPQRLNALHCRMLQLPRPLLRWGGTAAQQRSPAGPVAALAGAAALPVARHVCHGGRAAAGEKCAAAQLFLSLLRMLCIQKQQLLILFLLFRVWVIAPAVALPKVGCGWLLLLERAFPSTFPALRPR